MSRRLFFGFVCALVSMPFIATGWHLGRYAATDDLGYLSLAILCYFLGAFLSGIRAAWESEVNRERT